MWPQFIYQKFKMEIFSPLKHWQSSLLVLIQCTRKENKRIKFSFLNRPFTCCTEFLYKISGNRLYWYSNWRMMGAGRWFCLQSVSSHLQTFLLTLWMTICHTRQWTQIRISCVWTGLRSDCTTFFWFAQHYISSAFPYSTFNVSKLPLPLYCFSYCTQIVHSKEQQTTITGVQRLRNWMTGFLV